MYSLIKERILYFKNNRFVKSVATLQSTAVIGNFTQALISVFIARLLQPEKFGVYALALGLASLVFISTGVQETCLMILGKTYVKNDEAGTKNALTLFVRFTLIFIGITLVITALLPIISKFFYHNYKIGLYAAVIIIASSVSSTVFSISTMLLQVVGKIKRMATLILVDQLLRFLLSLGLIALGFGLAGAVLGHLIGALIIFIASVFIWNRIRKQYPIFPSLSELFASKLTTQHKHYFNFSLWATLDKNIASLYSILPVLLLGIYVTTSEVTFFKLAFAYIMLVLSLLNPVSVLLNFEFSRMRIEDPGRVRDNFLKVSGYSLLVSAILILGSVIIAPLVFKILYGPNFLVSVKYVYGLFVFGALFGIGVGLGSMWRAINRVKTSISVNLIVLSLGIPLGLWLIKLWGIWGAVVMVTAWYTVSHFTSFMILSRILKQNVDIGD